MSDELPFDHHIAIGADDGHQIIAVLHTRERRRPAVDKTLGKACVQSIRDLVLKFTGSSLPRFRVAEPVRPVGNIRPCPNMGDTGHQGINIAIDAIELRDLRRDPVDRQAVAVCQFTENPRQKAGMNIRHSLSEIGNLADIPQQTNHIRRRCPVSDITVTQKLGQGDLVIGITGAHQFRSVRGAFKRFLQAHTGPVIQIGIAPENPGQWRKFMIFNGVDHVFVHRPDFGNRPERAVREMPTGTTGDLGEFGGRQFPVILAIELSQARNRDMIDIHVQAHPDRIRRHQVIDLPALIHLNLRVAGARAQRPQNHRGTATLAAHQFGNRIDFVDRERDNSASPRQAGDLTRADIRQFR